MQEEKPTKTQNYLPLAEFGQQANIEFIPQVHLQASWSILPSIVSQTTDLHPAQINALTSFAENLAIGLAGTFNVLRIYNEPAIYRIMSILEPYITTTTGMDFSFPPKSSRKVIVEVTRRGKVEPTIYFDE